ncbi:MAG: hypothetical protein GKR94_20520 [Gammaproteobacteria bacterium]|nr:hypothetical protein [Gammaproteobacteria bacterium]
MRPLIISSLLVIALLWVGVYVRPDYPSLAIGLFTAATLLGAIVVGGFFGLY